MVETGSIGIYSIPMHSWLLSGPVVGRWRAYPSTKEKQNGKEEHSGNKHTFDKSRGTNANKMRGAGL